MQRLYVASLPYKPAVPPPVVNDVGNAPLGGAAHVRGGISGLHEGHGSDLGLFDGVVHSATLACSSSWKREELKCFQAFPRHMA